MKNINRGNVGMQNLLQKKDFYAGLFMVLLGAGVTLNSTTYRLGTLAHMGPGMFPFMLGILMTFVGVLIFIAGVVTPLDDGERILAESMEWRGWICILAGPLMFILFGEYFGMAAATFMCVFISALGDRTATLKEFGDSGGGYHRRRRVPVFLCPESALPAVPLGILMLATALSDLWYGFGVALEPHNLMWCFVGVLVGNMVGVLPGMGPLATISILLPLTFGMKPVARDPDAVGHVLRRAIWRRDLLDPAQPALPSAACGDLPRRLSVDQAGRAAASALGITMIASFVGASWGITEMIFLAPLLVRVALQFGPAEICSLMLLGLLAGSTLARGSPLKGIAMTLLGLLLGIVGTDIETGTPRFTFGIIGLFDGVELVALALGLFGIAEFMKSVNQHSDINTDYTNVAIRDLRPSEAELRRRSRRCCAAPSSAACAR